MAWYSFKSMQRPSRKGEGQFIQLNQAQTGWHRHRGGSFYNQSKKAAKAEGQSFYFPANQTSNGKRIVTSAEKYTILKQMFGWTVAWKDLVVHFVKKHI